MGQIKFSFISFLSVAGDPPGYRTHAAIEANFHVRVGFPKENGKYAIRLVGRPINIVKTMDYIGKLADGNVVVQENRPVVERNPDYAYDREKLFYCYFCNKGIKFNIFPHCESQHNEEPLVAEIMAMPVKSKERNRAVMVNTFLYNNIYM